MRNTILLEYKIKQKKKSELTSFCFEDKKSFGFYYVFRFYAIFRTFFIYHIRGQQREEHIRISFSCKFS